MHGSGGGAGARGSVSLYFIAATAGLVLITALLIDFARVAAFRKQAELATKSGVRSVLSSYDPLLYEHFGLFARGGEPADEVFADTLAGNAEAGGDDAFPYLDTHWESSGVTESRPLAGHDVFRRQVLEEMKYKAPIDLTIDLADRLRGMAGMIEDTRKTVDLLERMQDAYDRREAALDETLAKQRALGEAVQASLSASVSLSSTTVSPGEATGSVSYVSDAASQYDDYVAKRTEDEARREAIRAQEEERRRLEEERERKRKEAAEAGEPGEGLGSDWSEYEEPLLPSLPLPQYEEIVRAYESGVRDLSARLAEAADKARTKAEAAYRDAREAWQEAKEANEEMNRIAAEGAEIAGAAPATGVSDSESPAEQAAALAELRRKAAELVLESSYFAGYETELSQQREQGLSVIGRASAYASSVASLPGSTGRGPGIRSEAADLQGAFAHFASAYGPSGSVLASREASFQAHRSREEERKQEEENAKSEWGGASRLLGLLSGKGGTREEREAFDRVDELFKENMAWNKAEAEAAAEAARGDDPHEGRDEALSGTGDLLRIVEENLLGARDQLFFSEYAISRMTKYEPSNVKAMFEGREAPLPPEAQQAEYVLYGFANPSGNIAAAYGEIFAFRLAIRTMEGFVECSKLGHPLLVLVAALVYGIRNAVLDIHSLVDQGSIQLSKYAKIPMTYDDYLRLFLQMHGGSESQTGRMIAIVEYESGLSLREAYTYASGEGTASVKLWFFPGLARMLGRVDRLGGTVKGGRYEATYSADMAYQ